MEASTNLRVYKFGGASVKDAAAILNLRRIVETTAQGQPLLVIVSAIGKTTNALEEIFELAYSGQDYHRQLNTLETTHAQVSQELRTKLGLSSRTLPPAAQLPQLFEQLTQQLAVLQPHNQDYDQQYDQVVSFGELLATAVVAQALGARWLDCRPLVCTSESWREGQVDWAVTEQRIGTEVPPLLRQGVVVTQGFLGGTADGRTTTLGREGSDYSAAIFAYCLRAASVTIWKDVAGLLNADPKYFADTVRYPEISYQETIEMAYYGASVIHPKTLKPLADRGIPLYVKSFVDPTAEGTLIHHCQHPPLTPAFIRKSGQCLLSFASRDFAFISEQNLEVIFGALAQARLKINLMQNSALSFSVVVDYAERRLAALLALVREQFHVQYNADLTLYTIKNYDRASRERLTAGRTLLLEQRTRHTFQFLVQE